MAVIFTLAWAGPPAAATENDGEAHPSAGNEPGNVEHERPASIELNDARTPTGADADTASDEPPVLQPGERPEPATRTPAPTYAVEGSGGVTSAPSTETPGETYTPDPRHRRLQVGGAVAVGVGCGAFITMVAGLAVANNAGNELELEQQRDPVDAGRVDELEQRRGLGRGLAIGGGAAAGVLIVGGIATMAVGYKRARLRYQQHLDRQARRSPSLELAGGPGDVGTALRLRF